MNRDMHREFIEGSAGEFIEGSERMATQHLYSIFGKLNEQRNQRIRGSKGSEEPKTVSQRNQGKSENCIINKEQQSERECTNLLREILEREKQNEHLRANSIFRELRERKKRERKTTEKRKKTDRTHRSLRNKEKSKERIYSKASKYSK
jgi:hypothetical protein